MGLISNGTTIFDNGAMASGFGGSMTFISSATASSSASIEFTLGDYKEYQFYFVNIHPASSQNFEFQGSTNSGSSYGVTITSTAFRAYHDESDTATALQYDTASDLAQSTSFQRLMKITTDNDFNCSGTLKIFNPSSTTYVKHFISNCNGNNANYSQNEFYAGYFNTTSALTNIKFQMSSGNIDDGKILLFGIN